MALASEKKVLVVDDEPDVRNFLAACIEDAGFQVKTAVDGADALEKLQEDPPDLMTLDMVMPRVSGINLMRQIRGMEGFTRLPVIVITAHAHDEMGSDDIKDFNAFAVGKNLLKLLKSGVFMETPNHSGIKNSISRILGSMPFLPTAGQSTMIW